MIREAIADYLGQHEFRVTPVGDGQTMQTLLACEVVDLLVLDLKLRAEDGMGVGRRLRDESAIPIILVTGRPDEAERGMGLEVGRDACGTQPCRARQPLAPY